MLTAAECRAFALEIKETLQATDIFKDRAFILKNIARSLIGLATQLDILATKIRDESSITYGGDTKLSK